jgi:hypothetical protein
MVQYKKLLSAHIRIEYGFDIPMQNYFLSVFDDCLEDKEDASKEVNDVTLRIGGSRSK